MRIQQTSRISSTSGLDQSSSKQTSLLRNKRILTFESKERKKKRRKAGTVALRQIKYYQETTNLLLRCLPFERLVKEIAESLTSDGTQKYRWKLSALQVLQYAVESYLTALLEDTNKAAVHAKRVTIRPEDMRLVRDLRGTVNPNEIF